MLNCPYHKESNTEVSKRIPGSHEKCEKKQAIEGNSDSSSDVALMLQNLSEKLTTAY